MANKMVSFDFTYCCPSYGSAIATGNTLPESQLFYQKESIHSFGARIRYDGLDVNGNQVMREVLWKGALSSQSQLQLEFSE